MIIFLKMNRIAYIILVTLIILGFYACEEDWANHYDTKPDTVGESVWDALKSNSDASEFVALVEQFSLDSIFDSNDVHTLFVPNNEAIGQFKQQNEFTEAEAAYHILRYYIQPNNVRGVRKIQTYMLKFAQFENRNGEYLFDNIPVTFSSPLYENGRYFMIEDVATPNPSLYEHITLNNPALKRYIDLHDSIVLDLELSRPIGFDDFGNTIYDSVITIINLFEEEYFEVSEEFRLKTATVVFPEKEKYEAALTQMAINLDAGYTSHEDIPFEWQYDHLIPYLLWHGVFENMLEVPTLQSDTLRNILGERIIPPFRPGNRTICSNGYFYDYRDFVINDSLYQSPIRNEGERFIYRRGQNVFGWRDSLVTLVADEVFVPEIILGSGGVASNDTMLRVRFANEFEGTFDLTMKSIPLFPRRYLAVVRTHMDRGGIYNIYINNELVKTFDYYEFVTRRGIMPSVVPGVRYVNQGRYNKFDFWVDNIEEYGSVDIRFEYDGPGRLSSNELVLDYIEFLPESDSLSVLLRRNP